MLPHATIQYRDSKESTVWINSYMKWTVADIRFFNRTCGYERYRVVSV